MPDNPNEHREVFETWAEFVDKAENGPSPLPDRSRLSRNETQAGAWYGNTKNFGQAIALARLGWAEGLARMEKVGAEVSQIIPSESFEVEAYLSNRASRGRLIMSRYINDQNRPYRRKRFNYDNVVPDAGKVVNINFNITASGGVDADTMFLKGALIVQLAALLESAGRSVGIAMVASNTTSGWRVSSAANKKSIVIMVRVKRPEERLHLENLVFALAHASTLRRLSFSVLEQAPQTFLEACGIIDGNYGKCNDVTEPGAINILTSDLYRMERVTEQKAWLKSELAKQGIVLQEE